MVDNKPVTFYDVRISVGGSGGSNASYRNLVWENFPNPSLPSLSLPKTRLAGDIKRNNEIGNIESLGPFFRISFDLIIRSHVEEKWSNVLLFSAIDDSSCIYSDRLPAILLNNHGRLEFFFCDGSPLGFLINLNTWYQIVVEQKVVVEMGKQVR